MPTQNIKDRRKQRPLGRMVVCLAMLAATRVVNAQKVAFQMQDAGARNHGIWRLTDDPVVRDHANYHNIQCWSHDGRYVCYAHWQPNAQGRETEESCRIRVFDLQRDREITIDAGIDPRWAKTRNWLFYVNVDLTRGPSTGRGCEVHRLDMDTGENVVLTHGVERIGETDAEDRWLFGNQKFRSRESQFNTVRIPTSPGGSAEVIAVDAGWSPLPNPRHPVVLQRADADGDFERNRVLFDFDGKNMRLGAVQMEAGHMSWLGNGAFLLIGNDLTKGRRWDEPFPSNVHILSNRFVGDISPCGFSGRYITGDPLSYVDLRSGDGWQLVTPLSHICYPRSVKDDSGVFDPDPKGSPDGTKVCFVSNYDLQRPVWTRLTQAPSCEETRQLDVTSTQGFPDQGEIVVGREVIRYQERQPNAFVGLERQMYDTMCRRVDDDQPVTLWNGRLLTSAQQQRRGPAGTIRGKRMQDDQSPLAWQRQTDVYVVVARLPDRPHLRAGEGVIELIPGENHWETFGYVLWRGNQQVNDTPIRPGQTLSLAQPGRYTVTAVEYSGLQSEHSIEVAIEKSMPLRVLEDTPDGFSWTRDEWLVDGRPGAPEAARTADSAERRINHLHDGVIHVERFRAGKRVQRDDLNRKGETTRRMTYRDNRLEVREYFTDGNLINRELFDEAGFIIERIQWRHDRGRAAERQHWWYERGMPVKMTRGGRRSWAKVGARWVGEGDEGETGNQVRQPGGSDDHGEIGKHRQRTPKRERGDKRSRGDRGQKRDRDDPGKRDNRSESNGAADPV